MPVADCTSGFRCWRREALAQVPLERIVSDGYAFLVEMLYEAHRSGCSIGEVPIIFVERRVGESKMSGGVIFESAYMPSRVVLRRAAADGEPGPPRKVMAETVVMVATSYPRFAGDITGTFMEPIVRGLADARPRRARRPALAPEADARPLEAAASPPLRSATRHIRR